MHHRITTALFALLMVSLLAGCQIGAAPLSQSQLKDYLRDQQITPLVVEEVGGVVTVVLWKDARKLGCYVAWARNGIEADQQIAYINGTQQGKLPQPITVIYDSAFNSNLVCLLINDQDLRKKASVVKITFLDKQEVAEQVNGREAMVLSETSKVGGTDFYLIIYDNSQNAIASIKTPNFR